MLVSYPTVQWRREIILMKKLNKWISQLEKAKLKPRQGVILKEIKKKWMNTQEMRWCGKD